MKNMIRRSRILLAMAVAMLVGALSVVPAQSQELTPEHLELARRYIELTDHSGMYEATIVQAGISTMRQLLPTNPDIAEPLNEAIETVLKSYNGRKNELYDQFARVYALTFSEEELKEIVAFYESPTGTKLAKASAGLTRTNSRVLTIFRDNLGKEFFAAVRAELKAKGIDT